MKNMRFVPLAVWLALLAAPVAVHSQPQSSPAILAPPPSTTSVGSMPAGESSVIPAGSPAAELTFAPAPSNTFIVEWVTLLRIYDRQMDRLARELGRKYRRLLKLPDDGSYIPAEDLVGSATMVRLCSSTGSRNLLFVNVSNAPCLAAARQEYAALKGLYEKALMQAFANWMSVVTSGKEEGAVAAWEAVDDLRIMRRSLFGSANPGEREPGMWDLVAKSATQQIVDAAKAGTGWLLKLGPTKGVPDFVQEYLISKGFAATDFESSMGKVMSGMIGQPSPESLDNTMTLVTALGDVALDLAAYPPATRGGKPAPDYYGLGGRAYQTTKLVVKPEMPPVKEEVTGGYLNTGFAFKWNQKRIVAREFGLQSTIYREKVDPWKSKNRGTISLEARDMAELLAGRSVEKPLDDDPTKRARVMVSRENVYDWIKLEEKYTQIDSEYRKLGDEGEALWFERLKSPDPAKVASAIRLLQQDLQRITEESDEETGANELWKFALGEVKEVFAKAPGYLSPLSAVIDTYLEKLINYQSRDLRAEFAKDLNSAAMRAIRGIAKPPLIPPVFADGRAGIEKAITPGTNTPPPCMAAAGLRWKLARVTVDINHNAWTNNIMWEGVKYGEEVVSVDSNRWRRARDVKTGKGTPDDYIIEIVFDPPPMELIGGTSFDLTVHATARTVGHLKKWSSMGYYWGDGLKFEPNFSFGPDRDGMDREHVGDTPQGFVGSRETTFHITVPAKPKSVYNPAILLYQTGLEGGATLFKYDLVKP